MTTAHDCVLCREPGGEVLFANAKLRIVRVTDADQAHYPGFCRVIWNAHVKEMTDLAPEDRALVMKTVFKLETTLRAALQPEKINLASLGNITPHLHWHVIPRYRDDAAFPNPIWVAPAAKQVGTLASSFTARDTSWTQAVRSTHFDQ
jgi:diadenosine tetraphosphate (Ap4A) HIT family hydrolase